MSSRQFTPFGGSGEIVTLDNINEYDDLPPLAEIDSPDVYEIRTGDLGTDYLVPMQDGSTDFNEWYSLVDGQVLRAIPDSGVIDNFEDSPDGPYEDDQTINDFYTIDTEAFGRSDDNAIEGLKSLEIKEDVPADTIILSELGDGLNRYPASGQKIRVYLKSLFDDDNNSPYPYVVFLAEKTENGVNGYGVGLSPISNEVSIFKIKDGVSEKLSSADLSTSADEWFWTEIELPTDDNDIIEAEVYEVSNGDRGDFRNDVVANDNEFVDNRGVGFGMHDDDGVGPAFDGFEIL